MTDEEKFDFMTDFVSWAKYLNRRDLFECTAINFGYTGNLPMSQIGLTLENSPPNINLGSLGMEVSRSCSIVIISEDLTTYIDEILELIANITDDNLAVPLTVFLMEGSTDEEMSFNISNRNHNSPIMVNYYAF